MNADARGSQLRTDEVVVVYKRSDLQVYVEDKKNPHYVRLVESQHPVVEPLIASDREHRTALDHVMTALEGAGIRTKMLYRARLRADDADGRLIITVGGDGTLLDAAKKVSRGALLGVNSDPARSVGFLCAATASTLIPLVDALFSERVSPTDVARLSLTVDGERHKTPVLNDVLFAHKNPAATVRYRIATDVKASEVHKSSGLWISAPSGTTAGIFSAGGHVQMLDDARLQYRVRELYELGGAPGRMTGDCLPSDARLSLTSLMREGMIFIDGPHEKVSLSMGTELVVRADAPPLPLVVTAEMQERRRRLGARR
jgi:NAD kinase